MSSSVLEYKGYYSTVLFSAEDSILYGKLEMISDLVTFEGNNAEEVTTAFHEAVDDYIDMCNDLGKEPQKPFKGTFNVRISPELHKKATIVALRNGISLNQLVSDSISQYLASDDNRNVTKSDLMESEERLQQGIVDASVQCWTNVTASIMVKDLGEVLN